jgi:RNA polymerase sigma factor (sigma-70 family)
MIHVTMNGTDLLTTYREKGSQDAFSELVRRYTNLVYSIAKRRLSSGALAEEVAQTVFLRLARAAGKFRHDGELVSWLHRTTVHVAIDLWRSETRRRTREQQAVAMDSTSSDHESLWDEIAPHLDEALDQLGDPDRQAVLLRFFDRKPMRDVGRALGVSEDAAKMRVSRAIHRLRTRLAGRGVACTTATLASLVTERSLEAAPTYLVASLSSAEFAASAGVTGTGAALSLLARLLILMSKAKLTTALVVLAAVGIGVIGIRRALNSGASSNDNIAAISGAQEPDNPGPRLRPRPASGRGIRNNASADATPNPDGAELEDLKRELRALLQKPPPGNGYPPAELRRVLEEFGRQIHEAAPILLEALNVPDYETRAWSLSGLKYSLHLLRQWPGLQEKADQVFALARPVVSKILASPDEPQMLRLLAIDPYLPPIIYSNGAPVIPTAPLSAERAEDLLTALRVRDNHSGGIRFQIVDRLADHFAQRPDDAAAFVSALQPLLDDSQPQERLLSAYALASWPGEKPPAVKAELLAELKDMKTSHPYRAADGLARLGTPAADAVPELLAYADATRDLGNGSADHALEAACRLQPDLRARYPAIDAKLKQEEEAIRQGAGTRRDYTPGEVAGALADPAQGPALRDSFLSAIKNSPEPEKTRQSFVSALENALAQAPESQRAALQNAIDAIGRIDASIKPENAERPPLPMSSLVLDARVMLLDSGNPDKDRLDGTLNEMLAQYQQAVADSTVTPERFQALSKTIREFDPEFHTAWRKQVLKNYPWLDRALPPDQ